MRQLRRRCAARKSWPLICHMPIEAITLLAGVRCEIWDGVRDEVTSERMVRACAFWPSGRYGIVMSIIV